MPNQPFVVAGCIAHNRGWILDRWLGALADQTRPPDAYVVVLDDCTDGSDGILHRTSRQLNIDGKGHLVLGPDSDVTVGHSRDGLDGDGRRTSDHLAQLRNFWLGRCSHFYPQATHFWSVDSDILPDQNVLDLLLTANQPIVAAVVRNSTAPGVYNFFHVGNRRTFSDAAMLQTTRPFLVSMTGACCLYRADLFTGRYPLSFSPNPQGEDMGLASNARDLNIPLFVHPLALTSHHMTPNSEPLRP